MYVANDFFLTVAFIALNYIIFTLFILLNLLFMLPALLELVV